MNDLVGGQVDYMCDQIVNAGAADQGRHHQGLCHRDRRAQSGAAGRPDHQGSRPARLPGQRLERAVRAEGHAAGDRRQAQRGALVKALDDENIRKRLLDLGSVIPPVAERTPASLAALVKSEIAKWTPVVKLRPTDPRSRYRYRPVALHCVSLMLAAAGLDLGCHSPRRLPTPAALSLSEARHHDPILP